MYLANVETYNKKKFSGDSWQIEINKARLLMEQTMAEKNFRDSLKKYLESQDMKNSRNHKRREELRLIVRKLEIMRKEIVDKDTDVQ